MTATPPTRRNPISPTTPTPAVAPRAVGSTHRGRSRFDVATSATIAVLLLVIAGLVGTLLARARLGSTETTAPAASDFVVGADGALIPAEPQPLPPIGSDPAGGTEQLVAPTPGDNAGTGAPDPILPERALPAVPTGCDARGACGFGGDQIGLVVEEDAATVATNADGTVAVEGRVAIPTVGGPIEIPNADLDLVVDDDGAIVDISGTADAPLPTSGPLRAASLVPGGGRAEVGVGFGRDLVDLGAPLQDDREYFFFTYENSFALRTGLDELFGEIEGLPIALSAPGDVTVTVIVDPLDPFLYVGGACPSFAGNDRDSTDNGGGSASVTLGGRPGDDCAFAASAGGFIPFTPQVTTGAPADLAAFDGNVYVRASGIPVATGAELDGELVIRLGDQAADFGGNGDFFAAAPIVSDVLDLRVPFADSTIQRRYTLGASGPVEDTYLAGVLDSQRYEALLPVDLPVQPAQSAQATATGRLVRSGPLLLPTAESFIDVDGVFAVQSQFTSELTGAPVDELQTTDARLHIDTTSLRLTGRTVATPHPALQVSGSLSVDALVDLATISNSFVDLQGSVRAGETALAGDTRIRLDGSGFRVSGAIATPVSRLELGGAIDNSGLTLRGSTSVTLSTQQVTGLLDGVPTGADARAELDRIDAEIAQLRTRINADRQAALDDAQAAIDAAQATLDGILDTISDLERDIDEFTDELDRLGREILDFLIEALVPQALRDDVNRVRDDLRTARADLDRFLDQRVSAQRILDAARVDLNALLEEFAANTVDLDPRLVALHADRLLFVAEVEAADAVRSVISFDASIAATIDVAVGSAGIQGQVVGQVCSGTNCLDLVAGDVTFGPAPMACFTVAGVNGCLPF